MTKFNTTSSRPAVTSPVKTERVVTGTTYEGGPGYARDAKSELFLLAVTNMVGENTFYEHAQERDDRYESLVRRVAVEDPAWTAEFLRWLRRDGNMRSASLVGAAEAVKARLDAKLPSVPAYDLVGEATDRGLARVMIDAVLRRADEPGEMLAYWTSNYGRAIPQPIKRGIADAVTRLYTERSLLKYDTASKGFRFGDVLELVHARPKAPADLLDRLPTDRLEDMSRADTLAYIDTYRLRQGDLFKHAIDRRHGRDSDIPDSLATIARNRALRASEATAWADPETLREAGATWEDALSAAGSHLDKKDLWEALIPSMGYMALLRNLRNFDEAGVTDTVAATVAAKLADPDEVASSRQLPMRFLSAYKAAPSLRWGHALEQALGHCLVNIPALSGRTLILVDRSVSMFGPLSARTGLNRADAAAVFGTALAHRCEHADLVQFGSRSDRVKFSRAGSVLRELEQFTNLGGTHTAEAVRRWFNGHDRVVIVTDEQATYYHGDPTVVVPESVPVYTWNLAGYRYGHAPSGTGTRHTLGGLSDAAFRMIPLLEAGMNADWPWTRTAAR